MTIGLFSSPFYSASSFSHPPRARRKGLELIRDKPLSRRRISFFFPPPPSFLKFSSLFVKTGVGRGAEYLGIPFRARLFADPPPFSFFSFFFPFFFFLLPLLFFSRSPPPFFPLYKGDKRYGLCNKSFPSSYNLSTCLFSSFFRSFFFEAIPPLLPRLMAIANSS